MELAEAVKYVLSIGLNAIEKRVKYLAELFREGIAVLPEVKIHDLGKNRGGVVTFTRIGVRAYRLLKQCFNHRESKYLSQLLKLQGLIWIAEDWTKW